MNIVKNILKLALLLAVVLLVAYGLHLACKQIDEQKRYSHPITRPGNHW
jgi:hypothetical protein